MKKNKKAQAQVQEVPLLSKILKMVKITFEVILVIGFIFFEELIWKKLALPVKEYLESLEILQKLQIKIEAQDLTSTLWIFVGLLAITEVAGIYAGVLIVSGAIITGVVLYGIKVAFAGLTFWIFSFTKDKLLTISWFKYSYDKLIQLFNWVKSTRIYRKTQYSIYRVKKYIRTTKSSEFRGDINHVYDGLKTIFAGKA